jgi:hypothetical protein
MQKIIEPNEATKVATHVETACTSLETTNVSINLTQEKMQSKQE